MVTTLTDITAMAGTMWGESRNQKIEGQIAVAHVINNRVKKRSWYGKTIKEVCLKDWQFSCWNEDDPNRDKIIALNHGDREYLQMVGIAYLITLGKIADNTYGSTHYHTKTINPKWVENNKPIVIIGDHKFYNNIT
tara:strand:- start:608 stop:1015 length:408 start_codon:yes stop_codon:yes gene_type:complete